MAFAAGVVAQVRPSKARLRPSVVEELLMSQLPVADKPGIFTLGCTGCDWYFQGSAQECIDAAKTHSLANHIINVRGWMPAQ